jgi:hypothetical protein
MIEKVLGKSCGIICVEDLVSELFKVGSHFSSALSMVATFRLAAPGGHFDQKVLKVHDEVEQKGGFIGYTGMEEFLCKIL